MTPNDLNIVADENIPYVQEAFKTVGTVRLVSGRTMSPATVKDAQVLLVRSVTKVNRELLENSQIQFVGSATAGLDHIDSEYLQARGITFASAQGGNANSVAEYVVTAMLIIANQKGQRLAGKSLGIVGVGNIGHLVKEKAESLGMTIILNDPPLEQQTGDNKYRPLKEVLNCEVVTLHVPLTYEGPFKTFHLFNGDTLAHLKPSALFINTSRGEVVDSLALLNRYKKTTEAKTVLDVWESEPNIDWELFQHVTLGTPHIAGYSLDGKAQGTFLIYQALCQHLGLSPSWSPSQSLPLPAVSWLEIEAKGKTSEAIQQNLTTGIYDLEGDHIRMAELLKLPQDKRPSAFDRLRKHYPVRREFHNTKVRLLNGDTDLQRRVEGLGFRMN